MVLIFYVNEGGKVMKFSKKASIAAVLFVIMMVFARCSSNDEGDSAADDENHLIK